MALPDSYPLRLLRISSAVGKMTLNFDFELGKFFEVLIALNKVFSIHFSDRVAIDDICMTISPSLLFTGTALSTFFRASQPHAVSESFSTWCLPGTLPTSAPRMAEKSYFVSVPTRALQISRLGLLS